MKLPTLFKRTSSGKVQEWTVEIDGGKFRTISGQTTGKKTTSEWTVCAPKNVGKANETTAAEQATLEAEALHAKKLRGQYHEQTSTVDEAKFFDPMLAKKWNDKPFDVSKVNCYSQPKLDGIRCLASAEWLKSRTGKAIVAF